MRRISFMSLICFSLILGCSTPSVNTNQDYLHNLQDSDSIIWGYFDTSLYSLHSIRESKEKVQFEIGVHNCGTGLLGLAIGTDDKIYVKLIFRDKDTGKLFETKVNSAFGGNNYFQVILPIGNYNLVAHTNTCVKYEVATRDSVKSLGGKRALYIGDLTVAKVGTEYFLHYRDNFGKRKKDFFMNNPNFIGEVSMQEVAYKAIW